MNTEHNPYQAPSADLSATGGASTGTHSNAMVEHLSGTKPWVRFLSVLGFIFAGLMVMAGLMMTVVGLVGDDAMGMGMGLGVGMLYLAMVVLYAVPTVQLHKYANSLDAVVRGGGTPAVENALLTQKSFWKTLGIMALVAIGLWGLVVVGAFFVGLMSAATSG